MSTDEERGKLLRIIMEALSLAYLCNSIDRYADFEDPAGYGAAYKIARRAFLEIGTPEGWEVLSTYASNTGCRITFPNIEQAARGEEIEESILDRRDKIPDSYWKEVKRRPKGGIQISSDKKKKK